MKEMISKSGLGRFFGRLGRDVKGAVAMEYIVIALLVGAAVVALVMVFGGNLRNMFAKANDTMTSTKVSEVKTMGENYRTEQPRMQKQNETAVEAGNKLGGDFQDDHKAAGTGSN